MKVLVLGAGGAMAGVTVRDLLSSEDVASVVAADRDVLALERLRSAITDRRLTPAQVDVNDEPALIALMKTVDVVINATWYKLNLAVMRAAVKARVPVLDLGGLYHVTREQLAMHEEVQRAGIIVIPGMGSDPGTSNVLCRWVANKLDVVDEIHIRYGSSSTGQTFPFAVGTIFDEATKPAVLMRGGQLVEVDPLSEPEVVRFDPRVGELMTYVIIHSELATVPENIPGLKEMTYKDSWDPGVVSKVRALAELGLLSETPVGALSASPREMMVNILCHTLRDEKPSPGWDELLVRAKGRRDGLVTELVVEVLSAGRTDWGASGLAYLTGVPPSIVAQMVAKGEIKGTGVLPPENCVPPEAYLKELVNRGIEVLETIVVSRPFHNRRGIMREVDAEQLSR